MKKNVFFILVLILFAGSHKTDIKHDNKKLKELIANAPIIDISSRSFSIDDILDKDKKIVDSLSFIDIYQVDSLINKSSGYYLESPVYIIGKVIKSNYDILITMRNYGYWFLTLDMLTYNKQGVLKGFVFLAVYGGDDYRTYDSNGYFVNNKYFLTEEVKDVEGEFREAKYINCTRTNIEYLIEDNGEIVIVNKNVEKIDCPSFE